MAKSNSFFSLRRGSTKSLTFSVYNGKQVTRDRVTSIKNPRSAKQSLVRMRFSAVTNFLKFFKEVIERSIEGVAYGSQSVNAWRKRAFAFPGSYYNIKGTQTLFNVNMPLSYGRLAPVSTKVISTVNGQSILGVKINLDPDKIQPNVASDLTAAEQMFFAANPTLQPGDQITVCAIQNADYTNEENELSIPFVASAVLDPGFLSIIETVDGKNAYEIKLYDKQGNNVGNIIMSGETADVDADKTDTSYVQPKNFVGTDDHFSQVAVIVSRLSEDGKQYYRSNASFDTPVNLSDSYMTRCLNSYMFEGGDVDWPVEPIDPKYITGRYSMTGYVQNGETREQKAFLGVSVSEPNGNTYRAIVINYVNNVAKCLDANTGEPTNYGPSQIYTGSTGTDTFASYPVVNLAV